MNVVVGSAFRNMERQLPSYFERVASLAALMPEHSVRVIAVEGDSVDGTRRALDNDWGVPVQRIEHDHGKKEWGSVVDQERMRELSAVGNQTFANVRDDDDILVYVESDLLWRPRTMLGLIALVGTDTDVVAPLVFRDRVFYDIWAFRKDGRKFTANTPYHPDLNMSGVTEIDSAGSCLVMRAHVARTTPPMTNNALVEWCDNARSVGFSIGVAPQLRITHPH